MRVVDKAPPININLVPSRYMAIYLLAVHGCGLVSIYMLPLPAYLAVMSSVLIVWHCYYSLQRWNSVSSNRRVEQLWCHHQQWHISVGGSEIPIEITQATVWSWLIVIRAKALNGQRKYAAVVFPDSTDTDSHRSLRAYLRFMLVID